MGRRKATLGRPEINELARRQILAVSENALARAGVMGVLPTPLDAVAHAAGIAEIVDIGELPPEIAAKKPAAWKRVLGAFLFKEKVVFVDRSLAAPRARFTQGHETGHEIIPWHRATFELDNELGLFRPTRVQLDREANLAAAHLIFQGRRFHEQALDYAVSIAAPITLADSYAASLHATIRYYAEQHPDPVALVIAGRIVEADGGLPIWDCVESPAFRNSFGDLDALIPGSRLLPSSLPSEDLVELARTSLTAVDVERLDVTLSDLDGDRRAYLAEAFFNRHCVFILLTPRRIIRLGRRLQLRPSA